MGFENLYVRVSVLLWSLLCLISHFYHGNVYYVLLYVRYNCFSLYRALQLRDCLNYNVSDGFNLIRRDFGLANSDLLVQEYGDFGSWTK